MLLQGTIARRTTPCIGVKRLRIGWVWKEGGRGGGGQTFSWLKTYRGVSPPTLLSPLRNIFKLVKILQELAESEPKAFPKHQRDR